MASPARLKPVAEALRMRETQPGVFEAIIESDYCFGDWAWGGLGPSLIQTAAAKFTAKDGSKNQHPDVVYMQLQYLRPMLKSKSITISVHTVRATRPLLTVHVAIAQGGKDCLVGYVNLSDLHNPKGPSLDTKWEIHPPPAPAIISELENNTSKDWLRYTTPYTPQGWFRIHSLVHFLLPVRSILPSMTEQWITPTNPRNAFTNERLGMISDLWAPFIQNYDATSAVNHDRLIDIARQQKSDPDGKSQLSDTLHRRGWTSQFINTTVSLNLEIKKSLPAEGVQWLFIRAYAKTIVNGKYDIEVLIMDEKHELVALSHQTALAAVFKPEYRDKSMFKERAKV